MLITTLFLLAAAVGAIVLTLEIRGAVRRRAALRRHVEREHGASTFRDPERD